MSITYPIILILLPLIGFATLALWIYSDFRRKQALQIFTGQGTAHLTANVSKRRRFFKRLCLFLGLILLTLALSGPRWGHNMREMKQKSIDILFAVDISRSMLATDLKPNRFERMRLALDDLLAQLEGDRVGLIPFSGTAYVGCPLTLDYNAFKFIMKQVKPGTIPFGGTNLASAIRRASEELKTRGNHRLLVLITDGEQLQDEALAAAREAAKEDMTIHTIGVGSEAGEFIRIPNRYGQMEYLKGPDGKPVKSALNTAILKEISTLTGGSYYPLGKMGQGLRQLYEERINRLQRQEVKEQMQKVPIERFQWFLTPALLLLFAHFLISERKSVKRKQPMLALILVISLFSPELQANPIRLAKSALNEVPPNYAEAALQLTEVYKNQPTDEMAYQIGLCHYHSGHFKQATTWLAKLLTSDNAQLKEKAQYYLPVALNESILPKEDSQQTWDIKMAEEKLKTLRGAEHFFPMAGAQSPTQAKALSTIKQNIQTLEQFIKQLQEQQNQEKQNQTQNGDGDTKDQQDPSDDTQDQPQDQAGQNQPNQSETDENGQNQPNQSESSENGQNEQQKQAGEQGQNDGANNEQSSAQDGEPSTDQRTAENAQKNDQNDKNFGKNDVNNGDLGQLEQQQQMSPEAARQLLESINKGNQVMPFLLDKEAQKDKQKFDGRDW